MRPSPGQYRIRTLTHGKDDMTESQEIAAIRRLCGHGSILHQAATAWGKAVDAEARKRKG